MQGRLKSRKKCDKLILLAYQFSQGLKVHPRTKVISPLQDRLYPGVVVFHPLGPDSRRDQSQLRC